MLVNSLKLALHYAAKWHLADTLTAELGVIEAQRHQLRADWTSSNVGRLSLARPGMLNDSLHLLTSGRDANCSFSTVQRMNQRGEAPVDGFFPRANVSDTLLVLIRCLHHF